MIMLINKVEDSDWSHSVQLMDKIKHMKIASILLTNGQDSVIWKAQVEFAR